MDVTLQSLSLDSTNDIRLYNVSLPAPAPLSILLYDTTALFGADDVVLHLTASSGAALESFEAYSQTSGFTDSAQLDAAAAETLSGHPAVQDIGQLDAVASESLAGHAAQDSSVNLDILVSESLVATAGQSRSAILDVFPTLTLQQTGALQESASLAAVAGLALQQTGAIQATNWVACFASVALSQTAATSSSCDLISGVPADTSLRTATASVVRAPSCVLPSVQAGPIATCAAVPATGSAASVAAPTTVAAVLSGPKATAVTES